jgi:hypothetical protein
MRWMSQIMVMSCALVMVACGGGRGDVWSDYDYLTPVPQGSGVEIQPSERDVRLYRQTQDNDDTYVIPYQFGICNDGHGMGCD